MQETVQDKGPIPRLETERLALRPFCLYDAKPYFSLVVDPRVIEMTDMPHELNDERTREWIMSHPQRWKDGYDLFLLITDKANRAILGSISLFIYERHKKADLGYWIVSAHWGKGYATEAAREMVRFAFEVLQLHKLEANHLPRNKSSGKVLLKLGFKVEGLFRETYLKGDTFEDLQMYGLLRSEWEAAQQAIRSKGSETA